MTNEEFLSQPLSPHFRLGEFVRSATAVDLRIDNRPRLSRKKVGIMHIALIS